ncbi:TPM domain-containing protein [Phenylobacterium sp.]|jgi:putative membrane protein|uniref:TPM domain-containing protein n=1 Tax=Phenylobacterium sp. TaxID=1871053 RepID=UPI002E314084|nr:TPM domain-containing protein [Phenylobacterium sp.]HEX2561194.1 TPM domain-containing protein [Phenylobacterium sp.]
MLTDQERREIAEAIAAAEARTSGEIYCVLAAQSSEYRETPLAWAAGAALLAPALLLLFGVEISAPPAITGWTVGQLGAAVETAARAALVGAILLQALLFTAVGLIVAWTPLNLWLTLPGLKRQRVRQRAQELFFAKGVHETAGRTGVLVYVSLAEHRVELVADDAVDAVVEQGAWDAVVADLVKELRLGRPAQGLIAAAARCGDILARHFPPGPQNPNELSDAVVELR